MIFYNIIHNDRSSGFNISVISKGYGARTGIDDNVYALTLLCASLFGLLMGFVYRCIRYHFTHFIFTSLFS